MRRAWNAELRNSFLLHLAENGNIAEAARHIGVSRAHVYRMRDQDQVFDAAWQEAEMAADDVVEDEARRRALEVIHEPLLRHGQPVLAADGSPMTVRRYDDRMLAFLLTRKMRKAENSRRATQRLVIKYQKQAVRMEALR